MHASLSLSLYLSISLCVCVCVCVCAERERERERESMDVCCRQIYLMSQRFTFCFVPIFIFARFDCPDLTAGMVLAAVVLVVVELIAYVVAVVLEAGGLVADTLGGFAAKGVCGL